VRDVIIFGAFFLYDTFPHREGGIVQEFNLNPVVWRRLRIQGSALRSRTLEFQADLMARFIRRLPIFSLIYLDLQVRP
jgi:hypothetical protein